MSYPAALPRGLSLENVYFCLLILGGTCPTDGMSLMKIVLIQSGTGSVTPFVQVYRSFRSFVVDKNLSYDVFQPPRAMKTDK